MTDWDFIKDLMVEHKKQAIIIVRGTSMFPKIFTDDCVTLDPLPDNFVPQNFGLYAVRIDNQFYVHRYHRDADRTKGDNLDNFDPPVTEWLGQVTEIRKTTLSILKRTHYRLLLALHLQRK